MWGSVVVDTTPFRDWLDAQGLLWRPRRGTIKAAKVTVYQNANTEEPVYGKYTADIAVEVIDKSGGQDTFSGVTDYWYKVKSTGGPEGWVFGGYLTLGAELGKKFDAVPLSLTASSMLTEKRDKNMYQPVKVLDGKPDTGWMESAPGNGAGEWLEIKFASPVTADKLMISPGWFDSRYWIQNNRIKTMRIELDSYSQEVSFKDLMLPQEVKLPGPKTFSRAWFIIQDVYKTSKWDDTCIAEIEFWNTGKKLEIDISGFAEQMKTVPE